MTFAELSEAVIEREGGSPDGGLVLDDHSVATTLHHVHLPKLRDAGLIRWTDDGTVAYDEPVAAVESLFDLMARTHPLDASTP